jgi:hypothetical protein
VQLIASILFLGTAIAVGIAFAPYVLPILGIAFAVALLLLVLLIIWLITKPSIAYVLAEAVRISHLLHASALGHYDTARTACKMVWSPRIPNEQNILKRRLYGLLILAVYTTYTLIVLGFVLLLTFPTR